MSNLYLQCDKGAAGDMITAALLGLFEDADAMVQKLNAMGVPGVEYKLGTVRKYGIQGNTMTVLVQGEDEEDVLGNGGDHAQKKNAEHVHDHSHDNMHDHDHDHNHAHSHAYGHSHVHMTMHDIEHIVQQLQVSDNVKKDILQVYAIIADAESKAHNCPVSEVHFHEVGAMDAIADVAAVCYLMDCLKPGKVTASEIHVGNGTVKCAHGILPVPAPATANIVQDLPWAHGKIDGEICTPTGAALIRYFADEFSDEPMEHIVRTGTGIGRRTFTRPSYFRTCLCED